jgi:hypothetical protein
MKKIIMLSALLTIGFFGCKKDEETDPTPTPTPTPAASNTFKITSEGTYTVPAGQFTTVPGVTSHLQFAYIGHRNGVNNGGNIYFPLGSVSGTYNVKPNYSNQANGLASNEVAIDMASTSNHTVNIAQSGTVSLTVTGNKYKIKFTNLPSLTNGTSLPDELSADLAN